MSLRGDPSPEGATEQPEPRSAARERQEADHSRRALPLVEVAARPRRARRSLSLIVRLRDRRDHSLLRARVTLSRQSPAMSNAPRALPVRSLSSSVPRPPSKIQTASYPLRLTLLRRRVGSPPVLIVTPARALPLMSLSSSVPRPS